MIDLDPVDRLAGARLRARRRELGLSQEQLAANIGITFQQLQKYEKGANRISSSRLYRAARALSVGPGYFFDIRDFAPSLEEGPDLAELCKHDDVVLLNTAFQRIACSSLRKSIVALIEKIANAADENGSLHQTDVEADARKADESNVVTLRP